MDETPKLKIDQANICIAFKIGKSLCLIILQVTGLSFSKQTA
jgi:hypothetical protein